MEPLQLLFSNKLTQIVEWKCIVNKVVLFEFLISDGIKGLG